jgi:hypothetical protein
LPSIKATPEEKKDVVAMVKASRMTYDNSEYLGGNQMNEAFDECKKELDNATNL